jgi:hypothetical protein
MASGALPSLKVPAPRVTSCLWALPYRTPPRTLSAV